MNIITDRQIAWNGGPFSNQYDTIKVFEEGRKFYKHGDETFAIKSALRRALSSEYGGAWIEEKEAKKRYFIDESGWLQRSIGEVSKEEFAQKLETPATWRKVLGIGLGVLALAPGAVEFARHIPKEAGLGLLALQQKSPLLGTIGYSCLPSTADAQAMGTEFLVNTYTTGSQQNPSVAPLNDGGFVVTWNSAGQVGTLGIYGQRYDATGVRVGTEFQVNTYTTSLQWFPSVAPLNDGGFVITWESNGQDGDGYGIYAQRYNATGAQAGTEFQVNTYTTSSQLRPSVAPLNDGGFVVTWVSNGQENGPTSFGIFGQRYNATGARAGTEFQVNTYRTDNQQNPSVASLNDGGFVITWGSDGQDGDLFGIFGQRYIASGARAGTEFQVNTYTASEQSLPSIAPLNDGGFVITWESSGQDGDLNGIYGQRYNASGAPAGTEFQVNAYTAGSQREQSVAPLNNGGFVVTWGSDGQDGDLDGIFGQRYDATGAPTGTEFQVNTYTTSSQLWPSVAPLNDGGFVVIWDSNGQDGNSWGIFGQRYDLNGNPVGLTVQTPSSGLPPQMSTQVLPSSIRSSTRDVSVITSSLTPPPSQVTSTSSPSLSISRISTQSRPTSTQTSTMGASVLISSLSPSPPQTISTSSQNLPASHSSLASSTTTSRELGTQSNPTSTQGLLTSTRFSTNETTALSSNSSQNQAYTSSQNSIRTLSGSSVPSSTSRMPVSSGIIINSIIDIVYGESYPIYVNGAIVGTYTISGDSGQIDSSNPNMITMHFNPSFAPEEEEEFIPLFSIPPGQATDWQSIQLGDTEFECLEAHAEINPSTSGDAEFGLVFIGANSCTASGSQIVAGILPIMMN